MRLLRTTFLLLAWFATTGATCRHGCDPPPGHEPDAAAEPDAGPEQDAGAQPDATLPPDAQVVCADPCEGSLVLFGPETFSRACGTPDTSVRSFELPAETNVCLVVTNDGNAAARIQIDGVEVIGPSAFNPHVTRITASLPLGAGAHELSVQVTSIPGTSFTLEIRACEAAPPQPLPCSQLATTLCLGQGWTVGLSMEGGIICTAPGVDIHDNCATCEQYNLFVWTAGTGDPYCPRVYLTEPGDIYGGHEPCTCSNDLIECGTWELQGCVAD